MNNTAEPDSTGRLPEGQLLSRVKFLAILGAFAFPLLLATIWLFIVRMNDGEMGISARGELIRPAVPLTPFTLNALDNPVKQGSMEASLTFDQKSLRGIWTMLYAPAGECADTCQKNLYHMRQVRLSLAHRMDRVQRAVLQENEGQLSGELLAQHPGLHVLYGERALLMDQVMAATSAMESRSDAIYLIDPFGNLMMRFPADLPPKSMLKDIKHLLKVSRIG